MLRRSAVLLLFLLVVLSALPAAPAAAETDPASRVAAAAEIGRRLPLWSVLPFVGILLSIALFPLAAPHFWHHHYPKVSAFWALLFAVPFLAVYPSAQEPILHIYIVDYIPFIILLWSLFTIAGGIVLRGRLQGSPGVNTLLLLFGTFLASWIGTTGASMVMIRPVLRANAGRKHRAHLIVFFIFLVSNVGGSLTPLGDPPLFLGFLHGVPFFWTFKLFPHMALVSAVLLALGYALDRHYWRKEPPLSVEESPAPATVEKLRVDGLFNLFFLAGVVGFVLASGLLKLGEIPVLGVPVAVENLIRDAGLVVMGLASLALTPRELRRANEFSWAPIKEVAYLFAGIFMTILPAIAILRAGMEGRLGLVIEAARDPAHYFWYTGILSSFLDNAPTYLTFFNTALGRYFPGMPEGEAVVRLVKEQKAVLEAISAGAVFMGANTYIGNAPNFMVRAIAEEAGVRMPSFFGYMIKWSIPILIPTFFLITLVFFRS